MNLSNSIVSAEVYYFFNKFDINENVFFLFLKTKIYSYFIFFFDLNDFILIFFFLNKKKDKN